MQGVLDHPDASLPVGWEAWQTDGREGAGVWRVDRVSFADGYDAEARCHQRLRAGQVLTLMAERGSVRTFSKPRLPAISDRIATPDCVIADATP